jgi:tungstate transport system substrate-binding protein
MRIDRRARVTVLGLVALLAGSVAPGQAAGQVPTSRVVLLATTTSTQDSGLLDVLLPLFERRTGYAVKTVAVGTGQALALATRGEADAVLAHAPAVEKTYVAGGKLRNRRPVMYNDFVVVGPAEDPAGIKGLVRATDALRRIAGTRSRFVSRGDRSGTHGLELALWTQAGIAPRGSWYLESGQGMGQTLGIAGERGAYTITDRATLLAFRKRITLAILLEHDRPLLNLYSVMTVDPASGPRVNAAGGRALADFMVAPEAQAVIKAFGVDRYGQPLFVPVAGRPEDEVGG